MDSETLLKHICAALGAIAAPHYFATERSFQGVLQTELDKVILKHHLRIVPAVDGAGFFICIRSLMEHSVTNSQALLQSV